MMNFAMPLFPSRCACPASLVLVGEIGVPNLLQHGRDGEVHQRPPRRAPEGDRMTLILLVLFPFLAPPQNSRTSGWPPMWLSDRQERPVSAGSSPSSPPQQDYINIRREVVLF